jgi:hypothetical protein
MTIQDEAYDYLCSLNEAELERWVTLFLALKEVKGHIAVPLNEIEPHDALIVFYRREEDYGFKHRLERVVSRILRRWPESALVDDKKHKLLENVLQFIRESMLYQHDGDVLQRLVVMAQDGRLQQLPNRIKGEGPDLHALLLAILSVAPVSFNTHGLERWKEEYTVAIERLFKNQALYHPTD